MVAHYDNIEVTTANEITRLENALKFQTTASTVLSSISASARPVVNDLGLDDVIEVLCTSIAMS
jgi:hypothetical protein